jgi:hypothetical protein
MATSKNEPVTRNRRIYANALLDLMKVLYGVGIEPDRVDFARMDETMNGRVLFHPLIDNKPIFVEPHTIETLQAMFEAMKVYRGMVIRKGSVRGLTDLPPTFVNPSALQASAETLARVEHGINDNGHAARVRSLRDRLKKVVTASPEPAKTDVPRTIPQEVKATPEEQKNPNRVAAGRRNAMKRWEVNRDKRRR